MKPLHLGNGTLRTTMSMRKHESRRETTGVVGAIRSPSPLGNPMLTFDSHGEIERLRKEDA